MLSIAFGGVRETHFLPIIGMLKNLHQLEHGVVLIGCNNLQVFHLDVVNGVIFSLIDGSGGRILFRGPSCGGSVVTVMLLPVRRSLLSPLGTAAQTVECIALKTYRKIQVLHNNNNDAEVIYRDVCTQKNPRTITISCVVV